MRGLQTTTIALILFLFNTSILAQELWSIEVRPGLKTATQDIGDAELRDGYGFELSVAYQFVEKFEGYIGWGYNNFRTVNSFAGEDANFEETGYTFGLRYLYPIGDSSLSLLGRVGGIYNHIALENDAGDIDVDSDHGFGWEIGAGLDIDLGSNWSLRPQIGFRSLSRDLDIGTLNIDAELNYFSFDMGVSKRF